MNKRNKKGSSLNEFGPALALFLVCFCFPMIDLCGFASSYACALMLNGWQCEQASLLSEAKAQNANGPIERDLPQCWTKCGLGALAKTVGVPKTQVKYSGNKRQRMVTVSDVFVVRPWVYVPIPVRVMGLNSPDSFSIAGTRTVESATDRN